MQKKADEPVSENDTVLADYFMDDEDDAEMASVRSVAYPEPDSVAKRQSNYGTISGLMDELNDDEASELAFSAVHGNRASSIMGDEYGATSPVIYSDAQDNDDAGAAKNGKTPTIQCNFLSLFLFFFLLVKCFFLLDEQTIDSSLPDQPEDDLIVESLTSSDDD